MAHTEVADFEMSKRRLLLLDVAALLEPQDVLWFQVTMTSVGFIDGNGGLKALPGCFRRVTGVDHLHSFYQPEALLREPQSCTAIVFEGWRL